MMIALKLRNSFKFFTRCVKVWISHSIPLTEAGNNDRLVAGNGYMGGLGAALTKIWNRLVSNFEENPFSLIWKLLEKL